MNKWAEPYPPPRNMDKNPNWKGGFRMRNGYVWVRVPNHPKANNGYIPYHRLVVEMFLGRYLKSNEVIHHINHDKTDNRLENLQLFQSSKEHREQHLKDKQRFLKYMQRKKDLDTIKRSVVYMKKQEEKTNE